jgi:acyl carrier protein
MPTNSMEAIQDRVLAVVRSIVKQEALAAEITSETRLADAGLTSMDMVNLMLGVETEFDFSIPQAQITPDTFMSVASITQMVANNLAPAIAA